MIKCSALLVVLSLFLSGCQILEEEGNTQAFHIPIGTQLDLHQALMIPADQAGAFIQGTRIGDRYRHDATCRLEVRALASVPRPVRADRFTVERVNRAWEIFSSRGTGLRYARFVRDFKEGPSLFTFTTYLYLHSEQQPDVFRLVCSHLQNADQNPRHLTANEIRTVLTPIMTLH
ncbi:MAG: hypothetical protein IPK63_01325 [Candidatus Competibacteraceae bacterium]|nr:hypothetical protein [Candidatus Competibacteraceae bacterium]